MCFNTPENYQVRRNAGTGTPAWQNKKTADLFLGLLIM